MRRFSRIFLAAFLCAALSPAVWAQWTAYNDHAAGAGTHANVTRWNQFDTRDGAPGDTGPLKDFATGMDLSSTLELAITPIGVRPHNESASPNPGTPAYELFNGFVDFSGTPNPSVELTIANAFASYTFRNLDPQKLYRLRASAVVGNPAYSNRWTRVELVGSRGFVNAHSDGDVFTTDDIPTLASNFAVINFGDNRDGQYVGWDNVQPAANGTFQLFSRRYVGAVPGHSSDGTNAFGVTAIRIEEIGSPAAQNVPLVAQDHVWRYYQQGNEPAGDWRGTNYNDSTWLSGPGAFATPGENLGGRTIRTQLARSVNGTQITTYYFRTRFNLPNDPSQVTLTVTNVVDDGCIHYVNGVEVARFGMTSANVTYSTFANRANEVGDHGNETYVIPASLLNEGTNYLVVEVHDGNAGSSDLGLAAEVWMAVPAATPLTIVTQPESQTVEETKTAVFQVGVSGGRPSYQWFHDGVAIAGATRDTLRIENVDVNDEGEYWVTVGNFFGSETSIRATLTVLGDTNAPALVGADGTMSLTNVLVSFSELVSPNTATNLTNYRITNTVSGATLTILSARLVNGTNVLLHTTARTSGQNYILVVNNIRDVSTRSNLITPNSAYPVSQSLTLVPFNAGYRFFDPFVTLIPGFSDDPYLPPDAEGDQWMDFSYNDTGAPWGNGQSVFYGGIFFENIPGGIGSSLSPSLGTISYFRGHFDFQASPSGLRVFLDHIVDDGAVFYLNGVEVHRFRVPPGPAGTGTVAVTAIGDATIVEAGEIPTSSLRRGDNVFAASLHQVAAGDVDRTFGAELRASVQSFVVGPVVYLGGPQDVTVFEGDSVTFSFTSVGSSRYQWQTNNVRIPGATNATFTITQVPLTMNGVRFRAGISNATTGTFTTNATLRVLSDTNAPLLVSAFLSNNTITVSYNEPIDQATGTTPGNYTVTNSAGTRINVTSASRVNGTNIVLSFATLPAGRYTVVVNNVEDDSVAGNKIAPGSAVTVGVEVVLGMTDAWKVRQDAVALDGQPWTTLTYNDSTWNGPSNALLYVEGSALPAQKNTLLSLFAPDGTTRVETYYFRKSFSSPITGTVTARLRHVIDDGVILYLNGTEIYRFNMPAGAVTYTTDAGPAIGDAGLVGPIDLVLNNLGTTNVLAAEVHQTGATSTDVVFGMELIYGSSSEVIPPPQAVQIVSQPQSQSVDVGGNASFTVTAVGAQPIFYQWRKGGVAIPGAVGATYTINGVTSDDAGTYSVVVSNALNSVTSSNATLTVTGSTCMPIAFTAPDLNHMKQGTNIVLSWTNPATNSCGSNAVYTLQQTLTLGTNNAWNNVTTTSPYIAAPTNTSRFFRLRLQ